MPSLRGWILPLLLVAAEVKEQVEIQVKYKGYIDRQLEQVKRMSRMESARIPAGFDYHGITGITAEVREKLARFQPGTLGQASRIPGDYSGGYCGSLYSIKGRD